MRDSNDTKSDYDIALERIAAEAQACTGRLDLRWLDIETLPEELFELTHLTELLLGNPAYNDNHIYVQKDTYRLLSLDGIEQLFSLQSLTFSNMAADNLSPLANIPSLQFLNFSNTQVFDLTPLKNLTALRSINCSRTGIGDLTPLAGLIALQTLVFNNTKIDDLMSLVELAALQSISCANTQISDLTPLAKLTALQFLDCTNTAINDLTPLANLKTLHTLKCGSTRIDDLTPLANLRAIEELNCSTTSIRTLAPLNGLTALRAIACYLTEVNDLTPLAGLTTIQSIDCSDTQISDLTPLAGLVNLEFLDCSETHINDLAALGNLNTLKRLHCFGTELRDLASIAKFTALESLDCSNTQISDLAPLAGLTNLQELTFYGTQVDNLSPLSGIISLEFLYCFETKISDLTPIQHLTALLSIDFSETKINDLSVLSNLHNLKSLDCSKTRVTDISVISHMPQLESLGCNKCFLEAFPLDILRQFNGRLRLFETRIPGVPPEVLSQEEYEDCRDSLLAHLIDKGAGYESHNQCKLVVLGNGRVGKTQICRQLRNEVFDESVGSTHGITVTTAPLKHNQTLNLWDFGGQDIYHGTHGLFMRTRAIFLVAWTPAIESAMTQTQGDYVFRTYPLAYWIDYVQQMSGTELPLIVVQTQCDTGQDVVHTLPHIGYRLEPFEFKPRIVQFSAKTGFRRAMLDEGLEEAFKHIQDRFGASVIGKGRLAVLKQLEAMRDEDAGRPEASRLYQTLTQDQFREMCKATGNISSTEYFLKFLHHSGVVFYQEGLFNDDIVLDQGWALNAIYTVFDREKCLRELRLLHGRFRRGLLEQLVWGEFSEAEQKLFLSMMAACGICFVHRRGDGLGETEYIAPDLLPDRSVVAAEIDEKWDETVESHDITLTYPLLHDGLMRSVLSRIGTEAGINGLYWKGGVCLYERHSRARAMVEQHMTGGWSGDILIRTQNDPRRELLSALREIVEEEAAKVGLKHEDSDETKVSVREDSDTPVLALEYITPPPNTASWYVSYAWGDTTDEGKARDAAVEGVQTKGKDKGIDLLRDKDLIRYGDSLARFMTGLTRGERIFVILSDKYLKSPACMYELYEIWRLRGQDPERFKRDVRIYGLSCARIFSLEDRLDYAGFWATKHKAITQKIEEYGHEILGGSGLIEHVRIGEFRSHITDILTVIADTWQARTIDDFCAYAFE